MRHPDLLRAAIAVHLDLNGLGVEVSELPDGSAFGVYLGDRRIGSIAEKYASIGRRRPLGDFLSADAPWDRLRDNLIEALEHLQPRVTEPSTAAARAELVARAFPGGDADAAFALAVEATRRIRSERARDYPFVTTLDADGGRLTVHPVKALAGGRVPFVFGFAGGATVRGVLQLGALGDVLPVTIDGNVTDSALRAAWVAVLSGFADLTCPVAATGYEEQMWIAKSLIPTERTTRLISSTVAGHRRRLDGEKHHGEEAAERAAAIGIELAENETWVRSHTRGAPADSVLEFGWTLAAELLALLGTEDAYQNAA